MKYKHFKVSVITVYGIGVNCNINYGIVLKNKKQRAITASWVSTKLL